MSDKESRRSPRYEYRNSPEGEARTREVLGIATPGPEETVSINPQDYQVPHKFMWAIRGIPMGSHDGVEIPAINIPPECQHAFAVHLELCGFEHNPEKQVIVHMKPELGDDTPMNPGRWVRKSDVPAEDVDKISPLATVLPEPDLSMFDVEHLDAFEAAIKKAKIARQMAAQADPEARKEAEEAFIAQTASNMPTAEELKAAMDLRRETLGDPPSDSEDVNLPGEEA